MNVLTIYIIFYYNNLTLQDIMLFIYVFVCYFFVLYKHKSVNNVLFQNYNWFPLIYILFKIIKKEIKPDAN